MAASSSPPSDTERITAQRTPLSAQTCAIAPASISHTAAEKRETISALRAEEPDEFADLVCPGCATSYASFQKSGMLGCAQCYQAFRKPLEGLLMRVHGNTQHAGRMPGGSGSDVSIRMNIDRLREDLVKAIAAEEYEEAARLRDQVRALKQQLGARSAEPEEEGKDNG